jgi:glycosyltransferase involved in cell wall biosynthesis
MSRVISILMPFRNAEATLAETLASIAAQSLSEWELVAVDDGSEDRSAEMVRAFAAREGRTVLVEPGRVGLVAALNLGLERCAFPLVARMDADDVMHPERLADQRAWLEDRPDHSVAGSLVELFSDEPVTEGSLEYIRWQNGCRTSVDIANERYVESPLAHPSVMFRREAVPRCGRISRRGLSGGLRVVAADAREGRDDLEGAADAAAVARLRSADVED